MNPWTPAERYHPGAGTRDTILTNTDPLGIHRVLDAKAFKGGVPREQCASAENRDEQQCLYETHGKSKSRIVSVSFVTKRNSLKIIPNA